MRPENIGGRYRVVRAIGRGGMGTVWLCRDEKLAREVAVKQVGLMPGHSDTDTARAMREARSTAALSHRNVVTVFDVIEEDDHIWLVMEHVPSRTLARLIRDEGPLSPSRAAWIGAQVADGLVAAHRAGITHRDVKPGNIFVGDGLAKVGDFGISRTEGDATLTGSDLVTGTPTYFSPELATGGDPSAASDVWALGVTLYYAVEGRPPYEHRENPVAVLNDIAQQAPPRPRRAGTLEPVLTRMLDRDDEPGRRRRSPVGPVLLGMLALAAAVLAVLLLDPGGSDPAGEQDEARSGATRQPSPSAEGERGGRGQEEPPAAGSQTPDGTVEPAPTSDPVTFVDGYYDTVPEDLDAGWAMLSPDYQAEVGRDSYDGFWSTIESVDARDLRTVAGGDAVEATVVFVNGDGETLTERHRVDVVDGGGGPLIAGDEAI
jgi:serine/threonine protein kinase